MWYNILSSFVPLDPNMYPTYYSKIKRPNSLIFGRKEGDATNITQSKLVPPVEQPEVTQYLAKVPIFGLGKMVVVPREMHVQ
jgi:hypothetical protein